MILSSFERTSFSCIPFWHETANLSQKELHETWCALERTFSLIVDHPSLSPFPGLEGFSKKILEMPKPRSGNELLSFLESYFDPLILPSKEQFHLTGYFQPVLEGSLEKNPAYPVPLYSPPEDLLFIPDLGALNPALSHRRWAGRKDNEGQIVPYFTRLEIHQGALKNTTPLLWLRSEIDAYFLHIQGSGSIQLPCGSLLTVRYAASNGHPYRSVGNCLIKLGKLPSDLPLTAQILTNYLETLPKKTLGETLSLNPSYIFFDIPTETMDPKNPGPWGTFGTPYKKISLIPYHSGAVDPTLIPLGLPLWVRTERQNPFLCMAHDTGGAIKGPRLDLYCGTGPEALAVAGPLNHPAQLAMLVPKEISQP